MPISAPPNQEGINQLGMNQSGMSQNGAAKVPNWFEIPALNKNQRISDKWQEYFTSVYNAIFDLQQSGTTANRPTKRLYVGRPYFDTTINKPIWYSANNDWILADGTLA